jgi:hypothetical protein
MPIGAFDATCRGARAMLNSGPHQTTAAIVAEVEDTREWKDGEVRGRPIGTDSDGEKVAKPSEVRWELEPEYTLQISDCDRSIKLQIDWQTPSERANSLQKVETMIGALTEFRDALVDEQRLYVERMERAEAAASEGDEGFDRDAWRAGEPQDG